MLLDWACPFLAYSTPVGILICLAVVWATVWKGIALWRAGRNGNMVWFIALLLINTLGILEIIYIFAFSRRK